VNLEDISSFLALAVVKCQTIGEITKDGFVDGWTELKYNRHSRPSVLANLNRCDTILKQKQFITANKNLLGSPSSTALLEQVYRISFGLLLQQGQRSAEKSACISFWRILLSPPGLDWSTESVNWLNEWIDYVEGQSSIKGISRDQWNHVLKFARLSVSDKTLSFHSEEQSWPALIDDFVTHMKEKRGDSGANPDDVEMEY